MKANKNYIKRLKKLAKKKSDITRETFWLYKEHKELIGILVKDFKKADLIKVSRSKTVRIALVELALQRGMDVSRYLVESVTKK